MSLVSQIFGVASSTAYIRCGGSGASTKLVLAALASGFGASTGDGVYIHNLFASNTGTFSQSGFDSSSIYYNDLELNVTGLGTQYSRLGAAAIIYAYSNFSNIDSSKILSYINSYCSNINDYFGESYPDFTQHSLDYAVSGFSLSEINQQLSGLATPEIEKAINYNWYDSEPLFINPNLTSQAQIIKDSESQYYYLSGELLYDSLPTGLEPCIEFTRSVSTATGNIDIRVLTNTPCFEASSYIGPISGIKFFRIFSDGPGSSGYFDASTLAQYAAMDRAVLDKNDYLSNSAVIYSNKKNDDGTYIGLKSGIYVDTVGYVNSGNEYGEGHTNFITDDGICSWSDYVAEGAPLMRMHQGDNLLKWLVRKYCSATDEFGHCIECGYESGLYDVTGWKFSAFELKSDLSKNFSACKTNPTLKSERVLKRALNLNNNVDEFGNPISPYSDVSDTGDGTLTCNGLYIGPPQLNGEASLPGLVFFQTFDNTTFPDYAKISARLAISDANGFTISNVPLFSGQDLVNRSVFETGRAKVQIYHQVQSSGMSGYDDTFKKCMAMGDNFGNRVSGDASIQSNAGYLYTGYNYFLDGQQVSKDVLFNLDSQILGAQYSTIQYVKGYTSGARQFVTSNQYGFIVTGDTSLGVREVNEQVNYSYLSDGILGATNTGWLDQFAPVPSVVEEDPVPFSPIYESSKVENYLPRYMTGPYLTYSNKFLYPHAQDAVESYNSDFNGFPISVQYEISIKEETVREIFQVSGLGNNLKTRYIVRADANGQPLTLETLMTTPFIANDSTFSNKYNFLKNSTLYPSNGEFFYEASLPTPLVNQDYVPSTDYCLQGHLNQEQYQNNQYLFNQGVKYTGKQATRTLFTGRSGGTQLAQFNQTIGGGLYWGYKGKKITGEMKYIAPVFDLNTNSINPSTDMLTSLMTNVSSPTSPTSSNNGLIINNSLFDDNGDYQGKDPIFFEYVGGRSGIGADAEGGYHSHGIVGDAWYHSNIENWGISQDGCLALGVTYDFHDPQQDKYITLSAVTPTGLNLFTRALSYYPYSLNWSYKPFTSSSWNDAGVEITSRRVGPSEYFYDLELKNHFYPLKSGTAQGLYSSTGLTMGPFDRDVELCITGNNSIIPQGSLIIDGIEITNPEWNGELCYSAIEKLYNNSGIIRGEGGRTGKTSTFKLIPSGGIVNINISGTGLIGLTGYNIATIRPRTCLGAVAPDYDHPELSSGDIGILDCFRYIVNGTESQFSFSNTSDFAALEGKTFSITTPPRVEILFPIPESDFDTLLKPTIDVSGNKTYKYTHPTLEYWKQKTPMAFFSGVRETTRLHISIDSISVSMGNIPYQTQKIVIPSGGCVISGSFGYSGQAESAIISNGIVLSGLSGASSLSGLFEPTYVSEVLQRLPSEIATLPSGTGVYITLSAPSYMKKRKNFWVITGGDEYVNTSPYNDSSYNSFLWPAWSDLGLLNPEVVYEQMPPDDGNVFTGSYLTFSASQGQNIGTGTNPEENVTYKVITQYAFVDSVSTDALLNTGICIFSGTANKQTLNSGDLSGILTSEGSSLTMSLNLGNFTK